MRKIKTNITDRKISFVEYDTSKNWIANFPDKNWCLIVIADEKNQNYFNEIIKKSIERNVAYICSVGKQHDFIHDLADEEITYREVDMDNHYLPKHLIMTVGNEDFEEGIWFGLKLTFHNETKIDETIILDITNKAYPKLMELIIKMENENLEQT